jgi:hypothetical protein
MAKIVMLNDEGVEIDECEAHECVGDLSVCEVAAMCEDCGTYATPENPVLTWTSSMQMDYFACRACLLRDDFCRIEA